MFWSSSAFWTFQQWSRSLWTKVNGQRWSFTLGMDSSLPRRGGRVGLEPALAGEQEQREHHADGDEERPGDVQPDPANAEAPGLHHHEDVDDERDDEKVVAQR